jgi:membrane protein DedA with SNARE-associated domain
LLEDLINRYGVLTVLIGSGVEGDTIAFLGGVSAHRGLLPYWAVASAAALGSFIADQTFFLIGRGAGWFPRVRKMTESPIGAKAKALLERHPTGFILAFRFIYGIRTISPIVIGLSSISIPTFVALNGIAACGWGIIITAAGYFFGGLVETLMGRLELHQHMIICLIAAVVFAAAAILWLRKSVMASG